MDLARLRGQLRSILFESVLPFWLRHAIDPRGGLNTCLRDDGTLVSTDKWLWSQWRAVWIFARLHNGFGRERRWLDLSRHVYRFVARHGWDASFRGWVLCLDGDGRVLRGCESVFTDAFAVAAVAELLRAGPGDAELERWGRRTADASIERLALPESELPSFPYPTPPGLRTQGVPMIFSLALWELGRVLGEERYLAASRSLTRDIFTLFYRPDRGLLLERVREDGTEAEPPLGTTVVPGHSIEDLWFQAHIALDDGDRARAERAAQLIRPHCELGWDREYGGLFLAVDADGRGDVGWRFADAKLWWPHTEAIYALILAHEITREPWCVEWLQRVLDYSLAQFPVPEHGEWTQRLDRRGERMDDVVAFPVKDPFHLPRALMLSLESLDRQTAGAHG